MSLFYPRMLRPALPSCCHFLHTTVRRIVVLTQPSLLPVVVVSVQTLLEPRRIPEFLPSDRRVLESSEYPASSLLPPCGW